MSYLFIIYCNTILYYCMYTPSIPRIILLCSILDILLLLICDNLLPYVWHMYVFL